MEQPLLSVNRGCFAYPQNRPLLHNVDLTVSHGEIVAVLGPNGVGKTTLLKCLTGLLVWQSGDCRLAGQAIAAMRPRDIAKQIAYVPQARSFQQFLSVREMVVMGRGVHIGAFRMPAARDYHLADEALERLGILKLRNKSCHQISGGELQMVLIARALAAQPCALVLDEPESGLDFCNQTVVLDALTSLSRKGVACIFNTHYPAHALRIAHRSLLLSGREFPHFGDTDSVVTAENIGQAFGARVKIAHTEAEGRKYASLICLEKR